jgi:DNA-binding CsgD family transcriptional regulator
VLVGRGAQITLLADALIHPGLVVVAGPRGVGKSALVRAAGVPLLAAQALAPFRHRDGLPLARAVRAPVPVDDLALAAEAVRIRLRDRALLVDDVQHADAYTLAVLAAIAPVAPVVVTLRTPSPITDRLRALSRLWLDLPPLTDAEADQLASPSRPGDAELVERAAVAPAGGNPLEVRLLAAVPGSASAAQAAAALVDGLPVDARTALAALGLLGRPAPAELLGSGGAVLLTAGLAQEEPDGIAPNPAYLAEVAAGALRPAERRALHARLGAALPDGVEAARHLIAAGSPAAAATRAQAAAAAASSARERAAAMLVAATADPALALPAAAACNAAGLSAEVLRLLSGPVTNGVATRVGTAALRAAALVDLGHPESAAAELRAVDADVARVSPAVATLHAVASVRAAVATDPEVACTLAEFTVAAAGAAAPPALLAAHAAAQRAAGRDTWEEAARAAMEAAGAAGDRTAERLAGAALVAGMRDLSRLGEAGDLAVELAEAAAADGAYSAEIHFRAEALWAAMHVDGALDEVLRSAGALLDRTAPADARPLLIATLALALADTGALPAARALLDRAGSADADGTVRWVTAEVAWLAGEAEAARNAADALRGRDMPARLALLTARWARRDTNEDLAEPPPRAGALGRTGVGPAAVTIAAWDAGGSALAAAATAWKGVMIREQVRCLLGAGLAGSVDCLLAAEQIAAKTGLVTLLGRVRWALEAHGITRPPPPPVELPPAEREVLTLVGAGLSAPRIAARLGLTPAEVETRVRSAMATLGALTRTEAALRVAGG